MIKYAKIAFIAEKGVFVVQGNIFYKNVYKTIESRKSNVVKGQMSAKL